jgi:opacity protein-like surface antigen
MKSKLVVAGLLLSLAGAIQAAEYVKENSSWTDSFPVTAQQPVLEIENIWGDIRVRPGKTGEIRVTVQEFRSAPDQKRFDDSKETLKLTTETDENGVHLYVGNRNHYWHGRDICRGCKAVYQFDVLVPPDTLLDVSTVNEGRIDVSGVSGKISAANVNGDIEVAGMRDCSEMNSVNGEVNLGFVSPPGQNCEIETINGDITLAMPGDSGFDLAVDLFNGRLLTQLPVDALAIPASVEHLESNGRHQYRIEQKAGVRVGAGGPTFTVSSMNGDVRIQKTN